MQRPDVWDIKDKAPVAVPDIPEDADERTALSIITLMPMHLQLRYMRACQTVEAIRRAIDTGHVFLEDMGDQAS